MGKIITAFFFLLLTIAAKAQAINGEVVDAVSNQPVKGAIILQRGEKIAVTDSLGKFEANLSDSLLTFTAPGFLTLTEKATSGIFYLEPISTSLDEVVVSGTLKPVSRSESAVPVLVYNSAFFKCNPTPSVFDALQNVNGVRPQLNCNICNTGDIHINGLEGPYTMVLIDGMPLVSGLSTVYGLSGIPQALIDRVEVVKGPASTLYGSEAVGGLINIITIKPEKAPVFSADVFGTSWGETTTDISGKFRAGKKAQSLLGINHFNYSTPIDHNNDGFTDVTLQERISFFNKWSFQRKNNRVFNIAGRYVYEDRWGGQMNYDRSFRGGDSVYAESIYTSRWEAFGTYQLPVKENISLQISANGHTQNSAYGKTLFNAQQNVFFSQLLWNKSLGSHDITLGTPFRYTYYDDNTVVTAAPDAQTVTVLPGIFAQDEITLSSQNKLLLGMRYDYHSVHGNIFTPRVNYKWNSADKTTVLRIGAGNGYRVANIFTEDHAALTGSRKVIFEEAIRPEQSWNGNINLVKSKQVRNSHIEFDISAFHTRFSNKIIADYLTDANKVIYRNLNGYAVSQGLSANLNLNIGNTWQINAGSTFMDVFSVQNSKKERQLFTEKFTGTWGISCKLKKIKMVIDYTGNVYSPMKLPLLGPLDPRPEYSPWWSIQNIQATRKLGKQFEVYGGVKNLLNWTPGKNLPFLIARANDPFDKNVQTDSSGQPVATSENPYAMTFDPSYVYGPNQGIRGFLGVRFTVK